VGQAVEVEFHAAGTTVFQQGAEPVQYLRVVRSGAIELLNDGVLLDLLGEGELFGQASMLSGLPTGFSARAAEDTLCYRIPESVAREILARPESLRFVARSLLLPEHAERGPAPVPEAVPDPANQPVAMLIRAEHVVCGPEDPVREAAQRMTAAGTTSIVVELGDGGLGILTDRDLRSRVVAGGMSADDPVSAAMSAPAYTVSADRLGGEVLLEMLDRGVRHFPVLSPTGRVLGVVSDQDLVAVETLSSFYLRRAIGRADSVEELRQAVAPLPATIVAMHRGRVAPLITQAILSVVTDALTRRLIELCVAEVGPSPAPFAWLALGSQARREATPGSDIDTAIVWYGDAEEALVRPHLVAVAGRVIDGLIACGFRPDTHRATAADPLFVRSLASWQRAARMWMEDPTLEKALILVSVVVDSRPVWGLSAGPPVAETFREGPRHQALMRQLARFSLSYRPPTGFRRGLVVEHSGEHRGQLDLKHGGVVPIADLARWAGMAAGVTSASTSERLRAAGDAGTLPAADARTLQDAFELVCGLRLEHHVEQLERGEPPDNHVDPNRLSPLTRTYLKEAFRAVASVQRRVAGELQLAAW
jgi:CBS domain-containing protein